MICYRILITQLGSGKNIPIIIQIVEDGDYDGNLTSQRMKKLRSGRKISLRSGSPVSEAVRRIRMKRFFLRQF